MQSRARPARQEVAPGIQPYVPSPVNLHCHESAPLRVKREILFVFLPEQEVPHMLRLLNLNRPLKLIFEEDLPDVDLNKCVILHECKGKLDPQKSLSYYNLEQECQVQLVKASNYMSSSLRRQSSTKKRRNIEVEEGEHIKQMNSLGLGRVKDLYHQRIIDTKGVLITKRKERRGAGGRILNQDAELDSDIDRLYRMELNNTFELLKEMVNQKVETQEELFRSIQKAIRTDKLKFHQSEDDVTDFCRQKINDFMAGQNSRYNAFIRAHNINIKCLYALPLWTSDMFYSILNKLLLYKQCLDDYQLYLKYLEEALKLVPSQEVVVYRGFVEYREPLHKPGEYVFWRTVSSTSKSIEQAKVFTSERGTLFTIHTKQAKDIHLLSAYPHQEQFMLAPFTCYKIISYKAEPGRCCEVEMIEIPSPRSTNTIMWVADQLDPLVIVELEAVHGYSVLYLKSNSEALEVLDKFPWLLKDEYINFQVVTNGKQENLKPECGRRQKLAVRETDDATLELAKLLGASGYSGKLLCLIEGEEVMKKFKQTVKDVKKINEKIGMSAVNDIPQLMSHFTDSPKKYKTPPTKCIKEDCSVF